MRALRSTRAVAARPTERFDEMFITSGRGGFMLCSGPPVTAVSPVLIVDDDGEYRATVREILEDNGFAVAEAQSGEAALDHLLSDLSLIHISEPTRLLSISYAVF